MPQRAELRCAQTATLAACCADRCEDKHEQEREAKLCLRRSLPRGTHALRVRNSNMRE